MSSDQWQITSAEIALLQRALEAYMTARNPSVPPESSPLFQRARAMYRPGMSCRVLSEALGIGSHAARALRLQLEEVKARGEQSTSPDILADSGAQLLSKLNEICRLNGGDVVWHVSAARTMTEQPVTLNDVKQLAAQLRIAFAGGEQNDTCFDLDTGPAALFGLNGTYRKNPAGIASAYGDLIRYQDRINQVRQQSNS